jgi:hypothetical protein
MKYSEEWHEVWDYFGIKIDDNKDQHASCYSIFPADDRAADYVWGWYVYTAQHTFDSMVFPRDFHNETRTMGFLDAQDHYEAE